MQLQTEFIFFNFLELVNYQLRAKLYLRSIIFTRLLLPASLQPTLYLVAQVTELNSDMTTPLPRANIYCCLTSSRSDFQLLRCKQWKMFHLSMKVSIH